MLMYTHTDYTEQIRQLKKSLERESSENGNLQSENKKLISEVDELKQKLTKTEREEREKTSGQFMNNS